MDFSPDIDVPGPSEQEIALQQEQLELLQEQRKLSDLLTPFLFEEAGITAIRDEAGEIIGFEREEDPNQPLREEIERGFLERTQAALAGELPVNPALIRAREEGLKTLEERLRKQLGPGFETSSPGIEALSEFGTRSEELFEGARRGDLTLAESLGIARQESQERTLDRLFGRAAAGFEFPRSAAASITGPLSLFQQDRALQLQANITSQQIGGQTLASLFGAAGTAVGLGIGLGGFGGG